MDLSIECPIGCETERPSTLEVTQLKCGPLLVVENNAEEDRQKQNWQQRAEDNDHQQRANFHKVWSWRSPTNVELAIQRLNGKFG